MGIARSTFYAERAAPDDTAIVEAIAAICDEFEFYGWRAGGDDRRRPREGAVYATLALL
jgi:hypothetical protein